VRAMLFHENVLIDVRADERDKLIVAFRNFANAPKNDSVATNSNPSARATLCPQLLNAYKFSPHGRIYFYF